MTKLNINAIATIVKSYVAADTKTEKAKQTFESAVETRKRVVIEFADTLRGQGFTDCAAFKSAQGKRGQYHDALVEMFAACMLNKVELAAFNSDVAKFKMVGEKRVYSARHNAEVKVKNMVKRLLDAAEPYVTGERDAVAEASAPRGANANEKREIHTRISDELAKLHNAVNREMKTTGRDLAAVRQILVTAQIEVAKAKK
jgi:hypothetical protein